MLKTEAENTPDVVPNKWSLCPQCFRAFLHSAWLASRRCPYEDCVWRSNLSPYSIDYWSLRLLNPHLPRCPKPGVVYSQGTGIAIPHGMPKHELQKLIDRLAELDRYEGSSATDIDCS